MTLQLYRLWLTQFSRLFTKYQVDTVGEPEPFESGTDAFSSVQKSHQIITVFDRCILDELHQIPIDRIIAFSLAYSITHNLTKS